MEEEGEEDEDEEEEEEEADSEDEGRVQRSRSAPAFFQAHDFRNPNAVVTRKRTNRSATGNSGHGSGRIAGRPGSSGRGFVRIAYAPTDKDAQIAYLARQVQELSDLLAASSVGDKAFNVKKAVPGLIQDILRLRWGVPVVIANDFRLLRATKLRDMVRILLYLSLTFRCSLILFGCIHLLLILCYVFLFTVS